MTTTTGWSESTACTPYPSPRVEDRDGPTVAGGTQWTGKNNVYCCWGGTENTSRGACRLCRTGGATCSLMTHPDTPARTPEGSVSVDARSHSETSRTTPEPCPRSEDHLEAEDPSPDNPASRPGAGREGLRLGVQADILLNPRQKTNSLTPVPSGSVGRTSSAARPPEVPGKTKTGDS